MEEYLIPIVTFLCLVGAASASMLIHVRLPSQPVAGDTIAIVRFAVNILLVMTSVVLGLMLNSAKNTFEINNRNLHALATGVILLDRVLRTLGPEADEAHRRLVEYTRTALDGVHILEADQQAEASLDAAGASLRAIKVSDDRKLALWNDATQIYRQVVRDRWIVVDAAGGTIPSPLIIGLIVWLAVIFAGMGFGTPRNAVVTTTFVVTAMLLSSALYLVLEMDRPSSGLIRISSAPFERALAQMQR